MNPSPGAPTLEALGIDLESSLIQEPRFLHDAALLGALHAELGEELGEADAACVLLQLGFVHGLRDAWQVVRDGMEPGGPGAGAPAPTRLPMRMGPGDDSGALLVSGAWPERHEAEARLAVLGPADAPSCHASAGYTSGWLSGTFGTEVLALEVGCGACGARDCQFEARESETWRRCGDARAMALLDGLHFESMRTLVARSLERDVPQPAAGGAFEPGSPAIHVWGPVMVLPFAGPEESLRALELIGQDRDARAVRVVVVDLSGAIIDDGFGAVALERIIDAVSGWGAEPVLAGVSPLSMPVVADLEQTHMVIHKDLPEAIAAAFQIADAQRLSV